MHSQNLVIGGILGLDGEVFWETWRKTWSGICMSKVKMSPAGAGFNGAKKYAICVTIPCSVI